MKKTLLILALSIASVVAQTRTVTLAWDPNPEPQVTYQLHWGPSTRSYTNFVATASTNVTLTLPVGSYFAAVTAHDTNNLASDFSDELMFVVPRKPNPPKVKP